VAHVGDEPGLELARLAQRLGALVELGIKRDHAAIGIAKLLIELACLVLAAADFLKAVHQLAVLLAQRCQRIRHVVLAQGRGDLGNLRPRDPARGLRDIAADLDDRALAGFGVDLEMIHQPARADEAEPHPGLRAVLAVEDRVEVGDALALVADADREQLRHGARIDHEFGAAAAGVAVGVAGELGDRGGDAGLVLRHEAEQLGDAARALAHRDHVALALDRHRHDRPAFRGLRHGGHHLATSTVVSSRRRVRSR